MPAHYAAYAGTYFPSYIAMVRQWSTGVLELNCMRTPYLMQPSLINEKNCESLGTSFFRREHQFARQREQQLHIRQNYDHDNAQLSKGRHSNKLKED